MAGRASIQTKVDRGFAKAAAVLGFACQWYRPDGTADPIVSGNLQGTIQVLTDTAPSLRQTTPRQRQKPESWFGAFDTGLGVMVGDYLISPEGDTFFVTTLDKFRPSRLVICNTRISIFSPKPLGHMGYTAEYGGDIEADEDPVITGWPAALIKGPRGDVGPVQLPTDTKLPWEEILLPPIPGVALRNNMIASYTDETGLQFRLILMLAELTAQGYRCMAIMQTT